MHTNPLFHSLYLESVLEEMGARWVTKAEVWSEEELGLVNVVLWVFGWSASNSSISIQYWPLVSKDWNKAKPIGKDQVDSVRLRAWQKQQYQKHI